jgi:phosphoglycerate dehydrogenase-like enzyme
MRTLISVPTDFMDIDDLQWPGEVDTTWSPRLGLLNQPIYKEYDAWIIDPNFRVDAKSIAQLPSLKVIITASTGTNHIDYSATNGIDVYSLNDDRRALGEIRGSSEFTFLMILMGLRRMKRLSYYIAGVTKHKDDNVLRGSELAGKTVGIIGLGRIGSNIYRWVYNFGAKVKWIYDPTISGPTLENVFEDSDIVVISCALNESTIDMIGGDLVSLLGEGGVLVNSARGEIIVEHELVDVLRVRPDITYVADVLSGETTNAHHNSPLFGLNNAILTPHVAGLTSEANQKAFRIAHKLLWRWYDNRIEHT